MNSEHKSDCVNLAFSLRKDPVNEHPKKLQKQLVVGRNLNGGKGFSNGPVVPMDLLDAEHELEQLGLAILGCFLLYKFLLTAVAEFSEREVEELCD